MTIIAFHSNELNERGVSTALYDYAYYNQTILRNKSIIVTKRNGSHHSEIIQKFAIFETFMYGSSEELHDILQKNGVNVLYALKYGHSDNVNGCKGVKTVVHCVFDTRNRHGDVYAAISDTLNTVHKTNIPVVPHIVFLPKVKGDLRSELGIPENATVFGRYGGFKQFDIYYVHNAIKRILETTEYYFLFANTEVFYQHPRIIYLPIITDVARKVKFINTCDALLHARKDGETFGLTCGEFSTQNVPVITCSNEGYQNHSLIMGKRAFYYEDEEMLMDILTSFNRDEVKNRNWNSYGAYTPEKVMATFQRYFLDTTSVRVNENDYYVYCNDSLAQTLLRGDGWESHITTFSKMWIQPTNIVVDVGANLGFHSICFKRCVPNGKVISFEPQLENYNLLLLNASLNGLEVYSINAALGHQTGSVSIPAIDTSRYGNYGDVSVESGEYEVKCLRLDDAVDTCDMIKIDVQGYERNVLLGADRILRDVQPVIVFELENHQLAKFGISSKDVLDVLLRYGYIIFYLAYSYESDHIAVPPSKMERFREVFGPYIRPHTVSNNLNHNVEIGVKECVVLPY